jgi:hypothetical protein
MPLLETLRSNKVVHIVAVAALALILVAGGYFAGRSTAPKEKMAPVVQTIPTNPLFIEQTAQAEGIITAVENGKLTLKNPKGVVQTFPVSSRLVVNVYETGTKSSKTSASIQDIKVNEIASIILRVEEGEYKVSTVAYLPPPPSIPSVSGKPATPINTATSGAKPTQTLTPVLGQ